MKKRTGIIIATISVLVIAGIMVGTTMLQGNTSTASTPKSSDRNTKQKEPIKPKPPLIDLQPTIDTWTAAQSADFGIAVYDVANDQMVGAHQADKQFLMASIFKLYVAYLTLQDFQTGAQDPDDPATQGYTKKECVYRMINTSDNPCGDTMYNIMTPRAATSRLQAFGLDSTNISSYKTTAKDVNALLLRLHKKQDLSKENTDFLLDTMSTQTHRGGLPKGMPEATVADKVGFFGNHLWHDVGIVTLPNDRVYLVSIFGYQGATSAHIADFGQTVYTKLQENTQ